MIKAYFKFFLFVFFIKLFLIGYLYASNNDEEKYQQIYDMADKGNIAEVKSLILDKKYPVNYQCPVICKNWTPLMIATANGHKDVVKFLLEQGADPNLQNETGRTALHFAVRYDFYSIIDLLLKYKANPNIKDFNKDNENYVNSPMGDCLTQKKDTKILKMLINSGADVNYNYWDYTPLIVAARYNDVELVKILLSKGANPLYKKMGYYADEVSTNKKIKKMINNSRKRNRKQE